MFRSKADNIVELATSSSLIETNWETNMQICDAIRGQDISPKQIITAVKRRLDSSDNENQIVHILTLLEILMKNCGRVIHDEVSDTEFMISLKNFSESIKEKVLSSIQNWSYAFKDQPKYDAIHSTYSDLKNQGFVFPPVKEGESMFKVDYAPEWTGANECFRCKQEFGTFRRRHHCRCCGNAFCGDCSNKNAAIPKFGIEKEVRVCERCYSDLKSTGPGSICAVQYPKSLSHNSVVGINQAKSESNRTQKEEEERKRRELEQKEEEDLQLALALSASEAENHEKSRQQNIKPSSSTNYQSIASTGELSWQPRVLEASEMDPELARYLNREYWEARNADNNLLNNDRLGYEPSAPTLSSPTPSEMISQITPQPPIFLNSQPRSPAVINGVPNLTDERQEEFMLYIGKAIDTLTSRLRSSLARNRSIENDSLINNLLNSLNKMISDLKNYKKETELRRNYLESMQEKLCEIREAREALNLIRQDNAAKRREEEERNRNLRAQQLKEKVEELRFQKRTEQQAYSQQPTTMWSIPNQFQMYPHGNYPIGVAGQPYVGGMLSGQTHQHFPFNGNQLPIHVNNELPQNTILQPNYGALHNAPVGISSNFPNPAVPLANVNVHGGPSASNIQDPYRFQLMMNSLPNVPTTGLENEIHNFSELPNVPNHQPMNPQSEELLINLD